MKLEEPLTWPQFWRGLVVSLAVGFCAALILVVPVAVGVWAYEALTARS